MKNCSLFRPIFAIALAAMLLNGCVTQQNAASAPTTKGPEIVVSEPPPPLIVETVTLTPNPGFAWVSGAYVWQGRWIWEPGHWAKPPHSGAVWVPPHYEVRNRRPLWTRGYWQ